MPKIKKTKRLRTLSLSLETFDFLKLISEAEENASDFADKAIKNTGEFKAYLKETENA